MRANDWTGLFRCTAIAWAAALVGVASAGNPNCPADLDGSGSVGAADLSILLGQWGGPGSGDLTGNGVVGPEDLSILLGAWGPCPPPPVCPNPEHNCFVTGSPGCNDSTCCNQVCAADPFCCATSWDSLCVDGALALCGSPICPNPAHDCCTTGAAGCADLICCNVVCTVDPFCCSNSWDSLCVGRADDLCGLDCQIPDCGVASTGSCCTAKATPFCDDASCCELICASDPFCCATAWDGACANAANVQCNVCLSCGDPDAGDCCVPNATAFCNDASCCELVCASDPFCCNTEWDEFCASAASVDCNVCLACGDVDAGSCCVPKLTAYCSDFTCCNLVCAFDPFCCATQWDELCADAAQAQCLVCVNCPNPAHSCFVTGLAGCDDESCCTSVCAVDPFCCNSQWDGLCVNRAVTDCSNIACPNPDHACNETGTPGCSSPLCCNIVCAFDPFCCNVSWDGACVNGAIANCP